MDANIFGIEDKQHTIYFLFDSISLDLLSYVIYILDIVVSEITFKVIISKSVQLSKEYHTDPSF